MEFSILSSDSDSDLENLMQLSDWSDQEEVAQRRSSRKMRRVNYMQSLDDAGPQLDTFTLISPLDSGCQSKQSNYC